MQYNTRKSQNLVIIPLLQNDDFLDIYIIAIQEPGRNTWDRATFQPRKSSFYLLYPENDKVRVYFFINKRIDKST